MYDHRFWGPKGAYGAPLRHDWYYHCSDIPCYAHVPWEGCPYPPDVCHDPKYAYPPPLPVMGPIPPMPKNKCRCCCDCECNKDNTYKIERNNGDFTITDPSGAVFSLENGYTVYAKEVEVYDDNGEKVI